MSNVKRSFFFSLKLMISGILALTILSLFCLVYYNPPFAVPQPDRYTNFKYESDTFWSCMTEGFGSGTINSLGYNTAEVSDFTEPMIFFIGSSQTEALQVNKNKNFVSLIERELLNDSIPENDFQCVNLGVSGHFFNSVVSNFDYFAESFDNVKYAVIETSELEYSAEELEKMLNGEYHEDLEERGFLYTAAQKVPYLRLLKKQYHDLQVNNASTGTLSPAEEPDYAAYGEKLDLVMKKLAKTAAEHDFELMILYHHSPEIFEDNSAEPGGDPDIVEKFKECCEDNQICFIDTSQAFADHFEQTYQFSYGFANTKPFAGHLNENGHRLIAEALYNEINKAEEGK